LSVEFGPQFGILPYSVNFSDTNLLISAHFLGSNYDSIANYSYNSLERMDKFATTKYIKVPAYQNNKLRIQVGINFIYTHQINKRIGYSFGFQYRQGFNKMFVDSTDIWINYFTNPSHQIFTTKITGTSLLFTSGFKLYLNRRNE